MKKVLFIFAIFLTNVVMPHHNEIHDTNINLDRF